jgi:hypothetical protein
LSGEEQVPELPASVCRQPAGGTTSSPDRGAAGGGLPVVTSRCNLGWWAPPLRLAGALSAGLLWVLVVTDNKVFAALGIHLVHPYALRELLHEGSWRDLALGRMTWVSVFATAVAVALAHLALIAALEKWCRRRWTPLTAILAPLAAVNLVPLAALVVGGSWTGAQLLAALGEVVNPVAARSASVELRYPRPGLVEPAIRRRASVLVVLVESLRGDVWGPALTPELYEVARQVPCLVSEHHRSSGHETTGGLFSVLYGLNAYYWPGVNAARSRSWPLSVLRRNGYLLAAASASRVAGGRPSAFWMEQFDISREETRHHDHRDDLDLMSWLSDAARSGELRRPFFALAFLNSTHHNYHYPQEYERHVPVLPEDYDHFMGDQKLARFRVEILNRYKNSVLFADHLLASLILDRRDEIERGDLIVAITGDHGEEFWDHGLLGHAASHLVDARTRVPFLLFAAGVAGTVDGVSGHVDILPTVLDYLGVEPPVDPAAWSDGRSLIGPRAAPDRVVVTSAADSALGDLRLALASRTCTLVVEAVGLAGRVELRRATDPDERPIPATDGERELGRMLPTMGRELFRFVAPGSRDPG